MLSTVAPDKKGMTVSLSDLPRSPVRTNAVRLYQDDDTLRERLVGRLDVYADYIKAITGVCEQFFPLMGPHLGDMGVLVTVGVQTGQRAKMWCDPVDGAVREDVLVVFDRLLNACAPVPVVTAPVAFAIETLVGDGPASPFPRAPQSWRDLARAAKESGRGPLRVPDDVFTHLFP